MAIKKEEADHRLILTGSYDRFNELFNLLFSGIDIKEYAELVGEYFPMCDGLYEHQSRIRTVFAQVKNFKEQLMTKEELHVYNNLPDMVTVYRGCTVKESKRRTNYLGSSWTLDKNIAMKFANRNYPIGETTVLTATVSKDRIISLFTGRGESECIIIDMLKKDIINFKK